MSKVVELDTSLKKCFHCETRPYTHHLNLGFIIMLTCNQCITEFEEYSPAITPLET